MKRVDRRGKQIDRENLSSQYVLETIRLKLSGILNRIITDTLVAKKEKKKKETSRTNSHAIERNILVDKIKYFHRVAFVLSN